MLQYELRPEDGILIVTPQGPVEPADFTRLADVVDPYLEAHGTLKGLMICAEHFPGWDSFSALVTHLRFVKNHHQRIARVAAVSDSAILTIMPRVANHFVRADVKHFDAKDKDAALHWLRGAGT